MSSLPVIEEIVSKLTTRGLELRRLAEDARVPLEVFAKHIKAHLITEAAFDEERTSFDFQYIGSGRSPSKVILVQHRGSISVLKCGPARDIEEEYEKSNSPLIYSFNSGARPQVLSSIIIIDNYASYLSTFGAGCDSAETLAAAISNDNRYTTAHVESLLNTVMGHLRDWHTPTVIDGNPCSQFPWTRVGRTKEGICESLDQLVRPASEPIVRSLKAVVELGYEWTPRSAFLRRTASRTHGDLHPYNILIGAPRHDSSLRPFVIDFASAEQFHHSWALDLARIERELTFHCLAIITGDSDAEYQRLLEVVDSSLSEMTLPVTQGSIDDKPLAKCMVALGIVRAAAQHYDFIRTDLRIEYMFNLLCWKLAFLDTSDFKSLSESRRRSIFDSICRTFHDLELSAKQPWISKKPVAPVRPGALVDNRQLLNIMVFALHRIPMSLLLFIPLLTLAIQVGIFNLPSSPYYSTRLLQTSAQILSHHGELSDRINALSLENESPFLLFPTDKAYDGLVKKVGVHESAHTLSLYGARWMIVSYSPVDQIDDINSFKDMQEYYRKVSRFCRYPAAAASALYDLDGRLLWIDGIEIGQVPDLRQGPPKEDAQSLVQYLFNGHNLSVAKDQLLDPPSALGVGKYQFSWQVPDPTFDETSRITLIYFPTGEVDARREPLNGFPTITDTGFRLHCGPVSTCLLFGLIGYSLFQWFRHPGQSSSQNSPFSVAVSAGMSVLYLIAELFPAQMRLLNLFDVTPIMAAGVIVLDCFLLAFVCSVFHCVLSTSVRLYSTNDLIGNGIVMALAPHEAITRKVALGLSIGAVLCLTADAAFWPLSYLRLIGFSDFWLYEFGVLGAHSMAVTLPFLLSALVVCCSSVFMHVWSRLLKKKWLIVAASGVTTGFTLLTQVGAHSGNSDANLILACVTGIISSWLVARCGMLLTAAVCFSFMSLRVVPIVLVVESAYWSKWLSVVPLIVILATLYIVQNRSGAPKKAEVLA